MLRRITSFIIIAVAALGVAGAMNPPGEQQLYNRATTLLEHGRYSEARHEFLRLKHQCKADDEKLATYAEFGLTVCAAELGDNNAEAYMLNFLRRHPGSVHTNDVRFLLALHYSKNNDLKRARRELEKIAYKALSSDNREKYDMRMGYIEFVEGNHDKASEYFSKLSPKGRYADHAIYYKAYILYDAGKYDEAYKGFELLKNSDSYSKVVPYYLLQIEFSRGNYTYVVQHGDALLKSAPERERLELMRIMAEAWYRLEGYNKSQMYMDMYSRSGGNMGRDEYYILGYSAYRSTDYTKAIEALRRVCEGEDELAQNASYHLADCYLKSGNKKLAIYSFAMAADEKYNNEIAEDALFNYGKLLFETGGGTFNESINVLSRYIARYPDSPRAKEVRELLIAAYYNSHDYQLAYEAIKSFPNPDGSQRAALQKIAYFNGLNAFVEGDYDKAEQALTEARNVGVSPKYNALCAFWLGEIAYNRGDTERAVEYYNLYVKRAPKSEREYKMALYNLGYSYFTQENMPRAQKSFEGFLWLYKTPDRFRADAYNRLGDAHYLQRNYASAVKSYEGAVALGTQEQDYAKYQRAISLGLDGKVNAKIGALQQMQTEDCGDYNDDASYELGRTYVLQQRYADGAKVLDEFVEKYPASPYRTPALLNLGLVYFNLGDLDRSLDCYDKVIAAAPQSAAAKDAIQSVREIYVARGKVDDYFAYAERTGVECDLSTMTRDSLSFRAAQNVYLANRIEEAVPQMKRYLDNFPKGYYINDALFYLSDCYLKCDSLDRAVESMKLLADRPTNQYTVPVLEKLSEVTFSNQMYEESALAYRRLYDMAENEKQRATYSTGYAESLLQYGEAEAVVAMADDLATMTDVEPQMMRRAQYAKAKVLEGRGDAAALDIYRTLADDVNSAEGAEAAYKVVAGLYAENRLDDCEKAIYDFADKKPAHAYWLGKAFILLGDIYVARGDAFQAKATYRSVVDGYTPADDGIVAEASAKLEKLN
ncbi:MAG: tetratricopeptide repeat protein [Alistipes sp.]|nr:tetratricopeptide repeat protein [Alistipes sp.]